MSSTLTCISSRGVITRGRLSRHPLTNVGIPLVNYTRGSPSLPKQVWGFASLATLRWNPGLCHPRWEHSRWPQSQS
eukprot:8140200-Heterocapsa_arctica.AAC.1